MLAHLVSFENSAMIKTYKEVRKELAKYDKKLKLADGGLSEKEEIIILTKADVVDAKVIAKKVADFKKISKNVFTLSLYDDTMIKKLRDALVKILAKEAPTPKGSGSRPKASGKK